MFLYPAYDSIGAYRFSVCLFVYSFDRPSSLCVCNFAEVVGDMYLIQLYMIKFVIDLRFSPNSSTNKTEWHDIAEILLIVGWNIITPKNYVEFFIPLILFKVTLSTLNQLIKSII
jgi:hypothetical protein